MKSSGPLSSLKFYTTFGHRKNAPPAPRRTFWLWLSLALAVLTIMGVVGIVILTVRTYRTDFETTQLPPFRQNLTLDLSTDRFQVGDAGSILVALGNPAEQQVTIKRIQVTVPPRFLDAFTIDDPLANVERRPDSSGTITYRNISILPGGQAALAIPLQAERAGNYDGEIALTLDLAVPVKTPAWYMPLDEHGYYVLTLQRSIARELRVVLK